MFVAVETAAVLGEMEEWLDRYIVSVCIDPGLFPNHIPAWYRLQLMIFDG